MKVNVALSLVYITLFGYLVAAYQHTSEPSVTYVQEKGVIHPNENPPQASVTHPIRSAVYHGIASWYGEAFDGRRMSNGEPFDMEKVSVAHRSLPLGTTVRVTNIENGKQIVAVVTDRGPYVKEGGRYTRDIDLSKKAAEEIDAIRDGLVPVRIEVFI